MVTCQSANQLKTPAKVSWAFKMVSQFGSLGYTIMGKTADLTVVQKTIIDTLHKEGKPQTFIAKEAGCSQSAVSKHVNRKLSGRKKCGRKRCTTNRENRSLMMLIYFLLLQQSEIRLCWICIRISKDTNIMIGETFMHIKASLFDHHHSLHHITSVFVPFLLSKPKHQAYPHLQYVRTKH